MAESADRETMDDLPNPILSRRAGMVLHLTINRPPLNILDIESLTLLGDALEDAFDTEKQGTPPAILVLRATGDRAFSAGADVADHLPEDAPLMLRMVHRVARELWSVPCVTVAAVGGVALGAGMELALCCDLVVAEESAQFGQPEIGVGSFPPIAAALLPERVGPGWAADLILTGRRLSAREAAALGLVSRVAPAGKLDGEVDRLLHELTRSSPAVLRCAVKAIRANRAPDWSARLAQAEGIYVQDLLPQEDAREGVEAFLEKRDPKWTSQ